MGAVELAERQLREAKRRAGMDDDDIDVIVQAIHANPANFVSRAAEKGGALAAALLASSAPPIEGLRCAGAHGSLAAPHVHVAAASSRSQLAQPAAPATALHAQTALVAVASPPAPAQLTVAALVKSLDETPAIGKLRELESAGQQPTKAAVRDQLREAARVVNAALVLSGTAAGEEHQFEHLRRFAARMLSLADEMSRGSGYATKNALLCIKENVNSAFGSRLASSSGGFGEDEEENDDEDDEDEDKDEDEADLLSRRARHETEADGDLEGAETSSALAALAGEYVRAQQPPPPGAPEPVVSAYTVIMGIEQLKKSLRFELVPFLSRIHASIAERFAQLDAHHDEGLKEVWRRMLGGGKCQSRKTPLKVCMVILCRIMGVATVVATTGVTGRNDIFRKFLELLDGVVVPHPDVPPSANVAFVYETPPNGALDQLPWLVQSKGTRTGVAKQSWVLNIPDVTLKHTEWVNDTLLQGGCLIVNNSAAALLKARRNIAAARGQGKLDDSGLKRTLQFALVIDEADDFYRTASFREGQDSVAIKLENAMQALRELGPVIQFEVTATLLAIYMIYREIGTARSIQPQDIIYTDASAEYVGTDKFQPPVDANGAHVFLDFGSLTRNNDYTDAKVLALWRDAARHPRALCLDATSPAVTAKGNIYTKAQRLLEEVPRAVVIVVSGSSICWYTARPRGGRSNDAKPSSNLFKGKARIFTTILENIDRLYKDYPIFVLGYSQLVRGISYRSHSRVPTHMVLLYGKNMSMCRLVQAAGRSNGEQYSVLRRSGFEHVTLLTLAHDFDSRKAGFLETIKAKMDSAGCSLDHALGANSGAYIPGDHPVAQKRAGLDASWLCSAPPAPGQALGAEATDAQLCETARSVQRAVLEVFLDRMSFDADCALSAAEVLEELQANVTTYDSFCGNLETDAKASTLDRRGVAALLETLAAPQPHREPVLIKEREGRCNVYFVDEDVLALLRPASDDVGVDGAGGTMVVRAAADGGAQQHQLRPQAGAHSMPDDQSPGSPQLPASPLRGPHADEMERARLSQVQADLMLAIQLQEGDDVEFLEHKPWRRFSAVIDLTTRPSSPTALSPAAADEPDAEQRSAKRARTRSA
jgi:hypothetical protein